ncbi:Phosphate system positive regulatory protein PHO4 [Candida tropicalis]
MDQQVWNPIFSPNGSTPGKSPSYYNELDNQHQGQQPQQSPQHHLLHQQAQQQMQGHSNHSTPTGNSIQLNISSSQQPTPNQISGHTPGTFSETDQMFLQQMDYYEQQQSQQQQQLSHHPSAGNTPGPNSGSLNFNQHQHILQHGHQHHHTHSQDISQHISVDSNGPSNQNTPGSTSGGVPLPPQTYELGLENMNLFIPEVLDFDADPNHISSAFPPELPTNQTPSLLAVNKLKQDEQLQLHQQQQTPPQQQQQTVSQQRRRNPRSHGSSASPILCGQNDKSYNPQHYYHRQSSSGKIFTVNPNENNNSNSNNTTTVRPDAVFTPLVSPAVTPLERGNSGNAFSPQAPIQISFEPLTSPVLKAEPSTLAGSSNVSSSSASATDDRRRSSSSVYAPTKDENKQYKRRTPHGTPILQGNKNSYISPSLKSKSSSGNNSQHQFTFEKLPESKLKTDSNPSKDQDMLPPSGKPVEINGAPLMGFTMGKLAEGNEQKSRQTSPTMSISSSKKSSTKSSRKSSISKAPAASRSSSEESSPKLSAGKKSGEKPATKKASHKLAEQGRRNRMNMAVQELGRLIPQNYHDEVSIPSKATTVELASKYIRTLLEEIDQLKGNSDKNNNKNNNGSRENDE